MDSLTEVAPAFYMSRSEARPWGTESLVALLPGSATGKILEVKAGQKGRLQRHHFKDEAGHVLSGSLIVRWVEDGHLRSTILGPGQSYHFPPGCIHQEEAIKDTTVIEVSTPHANDREGMEHLFGHKVPDDALPSTTPEEVTIVEKWW